MTGTLSIMHQKNIKKKDIKKLNSDPSPQDKGQPNNVEKKLSEILKAVWIYKSQHNQNIWF